MMSLAIAADALKGTLHGNDAVFTGVSTDTRNLQPGDLFVALQGPNFDGHNFIAEAIAAGAAGALFSRAVTTPLSHILVSDTRRGLGELASFWRMQFTIPLIAITGSNGKTTVKEMTAAILAQRGRVCVTQGNFNNDIGMPLTLLRLRKSHHYAVIEMGMNHKGELNYLSRLGQPTVAVLNNAAPAHLAGLGTVEDVARAKGEIFLGLAIDGIGILNADDMYFEMWREMVKPRRIVTFGLDKPADVRADYTLEHGGSKLRLQTPQGKIDAHLSLLGRHNVMNALAATAAALSAGAGIDDVPPALAKIKPVPGRLEMKPGISGACVIDDTYNANPSSIAAGLHVLKEFDGERVFVMGDMAELGEQTPAQHDKIGELARSLGIHRLYGFGQNAQRAVNTFGRGARHFAVPEALIEALQDCMHAEMTLLIKGSRVMRMERIVKGIVRQANEEKIA